MAERASLHTKSFPTCPDSTRQRHLGNDRTWLADSTTAAQAQAPWLVYSKRSAPANSHPPTRQSKTPSAGPTLPISYFSSEYGPLLYCIPNQHPKLTSNASQPASVGFSTVNQTHSPPPTTLAEASPDVTAFLTRFAAQHPHYLANGLYLAAESFGGRYAPRFAADMVRAQPSPALPFTIIGLILVDALVDAVFSPLGHYEFFCTPAWQTLVQLNDSACATIAARMPEAERLRRLCELTMDPYVCGAAREFAQDGIYSFFQEQEVDTRRRSPYDCEWFGCEI